MPGAAECIAKLVITRARMDDAGKKAVRDWSTEVLGAAKDLTPHDTGKLIRSGVTEEVKNTLTDYQIKIAFPMEYAAAVHEIPRHHVIGQAGFLRIPFNLKSSDLVKKLESSIGGEL